MVIVEELVDSPDCESGALRDHTPSFTQIRSSTNDKSPPYGGGDRRARLRERAY